MTKNKEVNKEMLSAVNRFHFKEFCRTGKKVHLEYLLLTGQRLSALSIANEITNQVKRIL